MRKLAILALLVAAFIAVTGSKSLAQEKRLDSASSDFRAYYKKFIAAVHSGNKTGVASLTSFPLMYDLGNEDLGKATKQEFFNGLFKRMFGKTPSNFLPDKNPVLLRAGDTVYDVKVKGSTHMVFAKGGNRWFFSEFMTQL
jgi:hypothetical protein